MRCLLDTHAIIWCVDKRNSMLSAKAEEVILDPQNTIYFSSASLWEIAIKIGLGKLDISFANLLREIKKVGFIILHPEDVYLQKLIELPRIHKDPFDRLLIATAQTEEMVLVTTDENIHKYDVQWIW